MKNQIVFNTNWERLSANASFAAELAEGPMDVLFRKGPFKASISQVLFLPKLILSLSACKLIQML